MTFAKLEKILLTFISLSVILIGYLLFSSRFVPPKQPEADLKSKRNSLELVAGYKSDIKAVFKDIKEIIVKKEIKQNEIAVLKDKILAFSVPKEYRNLHVDILRLLIKMEKEKGELTTVKSDEISADIKKICEQNSWLN